MKIVFQLLTSMGVRVIVIAVGDTIDVDEINAIATDPDSANVFFIQDFNSLSAAVRNIAVAACGRGVWKLESLCDYKQNGCY